MLGRIISLLVITAIVLSAGIYTAGPLTRLGIWDYGQGLNNIRLLAMPVMIAAVVSLLVFLVAMVKARGYALVAFIALVLSAGAGYIPLSMKAAVEANPFIHDLTTDFENPPQILSGAQQKRENTAQYIGAEQAPREADGVTIADAQRSAFPDIIPLTIASANIEDIRKAVTDTLVDLGIEIIADGPVGRETGSGWRIESVATSKWFGFKDDFVVRIQPGAQGDVIVDVRSKSRVGVSDLGANAARIRLFTTSLKNKLNASSA